MESTNDKTKVFNDVTKEILNNGNKYKYVMSDKDNENLKTLIEKCDKEKIINRIITRNELDKIKKDYISKVKPIWIGDVRYKRNTFHEKDFTINDKDYLDELKNFIKKLKNLQENSADNINYEIKIIKVINQTTQEEKNNNSFNEKNKNGTNEKSEIEYAFIILLRNNYALSLFELKIKIKDFDIIKYILFFRKKNIFYKTENFEPKYYLSTTFKIEIELPKSKYIYFRENIQNDISEFYFDKIKLAESREIFDFESTESGIIFDSDKIKSTGSELIFDLDKIKLAKSKIIFDLDKIKLAESREFKITKDNKDELIKIIKNAREFKQRTKDMVIYKLDKQKYNNKVKIYLIVNDYKYVYTFNIEIEKEDELNELWDIINIFC